MSFIRLDSKLVSLLHIFIIGVILMLIGYYQEKYVNLLFYALIALVVAMFVFMPFPAFTSLNYFEMIKVFHYFVILPILAMIVYYGLNHSLSKNAYYAIGFLGLFVAIYHGFRVGKLMFPLRPHPR